MVTWAFKMCLLFKGGEVRAWRQFPNAMPIPGHPPHVLGGRMLFFFWEGIGPQPQVEYWEDVRRHKRWLDPVPVSPITTSGERGLLLDTKREDGAPAAPQGLKLKLQSSIFTPRVGHRLAVCFSTCH